MRCRDLHAVVDTNGRPVHLGRAPGEANDNRLCSVLPSGLHPRTMLLADRGYDAGWIKERFFNKITQCRCVVTRKLAANYLAFIKLASIWIWLRADESTP